jgi:hypothetical protein
VVLGKRPNPRKSALPALKSHSLSKRSSPANSRVIEDDRIKPVKPTLQLDDVHDVTAGPSDTFRSKFLTSRKRTYIKSMGDKQDMLRQFSNLQVRSQRESITVKESFSLMNDDDEMVVIDRQPQSTSGVDAIKHFNQHLKCLDLIKQ